MKGRCGSVGEGKLAKLFSVWLYKTIISSKVTGPNMSPPLQSGLGIGSTLRRASVNAPARRGLTSQDALRRMSSEETPATVAKLFPGYANYSQLARLNSATSLAFFTGTRRSSILWG